MMNEELEARTNNLEANMEWLKRNIQEYTISLNNSLNSTITVSDNISNVLGIVNRTVNNLLSMELNMYSHILSELYKGKFVVISKKYNNSNFERKFYVGLFKEFRFLHSDIFKDPVDLSESIVALFNVIGSDCNETMSTDDLASLKFDVFEDEDSARLFVELSGNNF